ncbi:MAG: sensor histidine kinase, partial [Planctomycetota bacterium]
RRQNRRIQAILDTAADGIISIGDDGIIRAANPAAERIFGYRIDEMVGRNVRMLMPEPDASSHDRYLQDYVTTGKARIIGIGREVEGLRKDGSRFPLELSVGEVRQERDGRVFTGILRDITDRKTAEQELRELNEALRRHQQVLIQSEKMNAMGQMAAGVAHEIANPLASMDSLVQLVQRQPDRMSDRTADLLREQISRINAIVQQLTDFAHPNETGWETSPLNDVVGATLDMLRFDHRLRDIELERSFGAHVGTIRLIPQAVQQMVVNLVMNAVDALEEVQEPRLEVRTRREGEWCVIEVQDNGHGIEPEHLGRVFEPFFTTKPVGRGTGLGLSITYSLVQRHDGRCEVRSAPGEGTCFAIHLPASSRDEVVQTVTSPTAGPRG